MRARVTDPPISRAKTRGVLRLWAVWFQDHIHTDIEGKLAVFPTRVAASNWIDRHGMPECKIRPLPLAE